MARVYLENGWEFKQKDENQWLRVNKVPSDVYTDLLANNKIEDPFVDLNELSVRWIADKDWVYRTTFDIPWDESITTGNLDLVFEGLDTFADVYLNDTLILKSDNMFLSHRLPIKSLIQPSNRLEIVFSSARRRGEELMEEHQHEHRFIARQTEDSRIPVRKAQYHWGWDWSPILTGTSGLWRPVYLENYAARIEDTWIQSSTISTERCSGQLFAKVESANPDTDIVTWCLSFNSENPLQMKTGIESGLSKSHFDIDKPKLWYPRGYGNQDRYELVVTLCRGMMILDQKTKLIGFRTAELIQQPDEWGKSFYFRVNGIDIFCGGSCWIPGSNYLSQISKQTYRNWARLLTEGNQTMLRIWGGGIYEDDALYDTCDELGILVLQDFCFACGSYPAYPSFLQSVEEEARQNVRRLRTHPSLICWTGSNEDYQVQEQYKLDYNYNDKDPNSWLKSSFPARYLYEHLLPKVVSEEDPSGVPYHPSSPWGDGKDTDDPTVGDLHQWRLWHEDMKKYQHADELSGRFISEFGMESYPHIETINSVITVEAQRYPGSILMDFHNKAIGHERRLLEYMNENFKMGTYCSFPEFIYVSQMNQAETMAFAYKAWRRDWNQAGARKCGGVLVWQLNDCWPTVSWAVVDHHLVKKPAYYSISRALQPVAVCIWRKTHDWTKTYMNDTLDVGHVDPTIEARNGTQFDIWIASSQTQAIKAKIHVRFVSVVSGKDIQRLDSIHEDIEVKPNGTTEVLSQTNLGIPFENYDPYVIHAKLEVDGRVVSVDTAWPQPLKYLDFSNRSVMLEKMADKMIITSARPIKGLVFNEVKGMKLSTNNLDIIPGEEYVVEVLEGPDPKGFHYVGGKSSSLEEA